MSVVLESSRGALSIGRGCKTKYQSLVDHLNEIDPYNPNVDPNVELLIDIPDPIFEKRREFE